MQERTVPMTSHAAGYEQAASTQKVLKNTYLLLSLTLAVSAVGAGATMALELGRLAGLVLSLVGFGLIFAVHKTADSAKGLGMIFAFSAVMGAALGPILSHYLKMPAGPEIVMQAFAGTAVAFVGLSAYAVASRKDFSFMGGFLMVGLIVAIVGGIANIFLQIPALQLAISAAVVMIMSGLILFDTSRIVLGGETNYIRATIGLYLNIYNMFTSLLQLFGLANSDD